MSRFGLEIDTDNAAFGDTRDDGAVEIARILRALADLMTGERMAAPEHRLADSPLRDLNGNAVGWAWREYS